MDETDRQIIRTLQEDGRTPYEKLARELGITGVAVRKRVKKMIEKGLTSISTGLNTHKLGYYLNLILLEIDSESHLNAILRDFQNCPRVISVFTCLSGYNLVVLVLAEDRATLESEILGGCSLRTREGVRRSEVIQIERQAYSPFLPVRIALATRDRDSAPCGVLCGTCDRYKAEGCLGCPSTKFYRGDM